MAHLPQNLCWSKTLPKKPTHNLNGKSYDIRKSRVEEIQKMSSSIKPLIPSRLPHRSNMKRASDSFDDEAEDKLKYQTLLKEYLELQKEFVSRKKKLQAAKQRRELVTAEVRFLKRKHESLLKSQAPNTDKVLNVDQETNTVQGGRNPSVIDQLMLSISREKDDEAEGRNHVHEEDVRSRKKMKDRSFGTRWLDRVTLNV